MAEKTPDGKGSEIRKSSMGEHWAFGSFTLPGSHLCAPPYMFCYIILCIINSKFP